MGVLSHVAEETLLMGLNYESGGGEIVLCYPGGPAIITRVSTREGWRRQSEVVAGDMTLDTELRERETRGHGRDATRAGEGAPRTRKAVSPEAGAVGKGFFPEASRGNTALPAL